MESRPVDFSFYVYAGIHDLSFIDSNALMLSMNLIYEYFSLRLEPKLIFKRQSAIHQYSSISDLMIPAYCKI